MQRALTVVHVLGLMLVVFSVTYLVPLAASWIYDDGTLPDFLMAMVWTSAIGFLMWLLTRRYKGELSVRHGYLLVVAMWTAMPAVATLPLLLVINGLSFTDAYFETMSGLTTTGATVNCSGWAVWESSCWQWRSCPCWASAVANCSRRRRRGP
jgi:trk system potassium uptake protein TrkH